MTYSESKERDFFIVTGSELNSTSPKVVYSLWGFLLLEVRSNPVRYLTIIIWVFVFSLFLPL